MALAFASMARVGDGDTFWAQTERGCGVLMEVQD
jgi:endonuclease YncB( thermonuclease family)